MSEVGILADNREQISALLRGGIPQKVEEGLGLLLSFGDEYLWDSYLSRITLDEQFCSYGILEEKNIPSFVVIQLYAACPFRERYGEKITKVSGSDFDKLSAETLARLPYLKTLELAYDSPIVKREFPFSVLALVGSDLEDLSIFEGSTAQELIIHHCEKLKDISAVGSMNNLRTIEFADIRVLPDLAPLALVSKLERLHLSYATGDHFKDIPCLPLLKHLEINYLSDGTPLTNLDLPLLDSLDAGGCDETLRDFLSVHTQLRRLNLEGAELGDYTFLSEMENLEELNLGCSDFSDLEVLSGLKSLKILNLNSCSGLDDFSDLSQCENLEDLSLKENFGLEDLGFASKLKKLRRLDCEACGTITRFDFLRNLKHLEFINLTNCEVPKSIAARLYEGAEVALLKNMIFGGEKGSVEFVIKKLNMMYRVDENFPMKEYLAILQEDGRQETWDYLLSSLIYEETRAGEGNEFRKFRSRSGNITSGDLFQIYAACPFRDKYFPASKITSYWVKLYDAADLELLFLFPALEKLGISYDKGLLDLSVLSKLENLKQLSLSGPMLKNLEFLISLPRLSYLDIQWCPSLKSTVGLESHPLSRGYGEVYLCGTGLKENYENRFRKPYVYDEY